MATIPIKRLTSTILSPLINDSSRLTRVLNGDDYISLSFTHDSFVEIQVDDYITWNGIDYYIKQTPDLKKISKREYRYELRFEGPQGNLIEALFMLDGEGEFYLTGIAENFVDLIVANLNRVYGAATYVTGTVTATDFKNLHFNNEDCLTVLRRLCEEFELEYYFSSGTGIEINLIIEIGNATLLSFEYADGLYNIKRSKVSEKDIITRLFAFGSERNIDYNYGAKRLRLPSIAYPNGYMEQNTGTYGVREAVHQWDDIYPHFEGSVTSTPSETEVIDTLIDFDLNNYLIEGVKPKVVFLTGDLAGYEFTIPEDGFDYANKKITFETYTDETGLTLPNTLIKPAIGDEFTFVDITMPTAYITAAESALETAATALLTERSSPNVQYEIEMDWHDLQNTDTSLDVGDIIIITDPELASGGVNFRILEFTQSIANKYKYTVKVGESLLIGYIKRTINERERIKHEVVIVRDESVLDIRRGYQMIDELQDSIFDQDGYFDPVNIKPLSIETLMLAVGAKSTQLTLNGVLAQPNYQGNENYLDISAGDLIHFTIAATVQTWNIASYNSTTLVSGTAYYMYVKCNKSSASATWLVTNVQYEVDPDDGYYYFLVGFLSSVISDLRRISWLYGQTTINGGFITAGRIQDLSGNIYFDLESGVVETTKAGISANDTGDTAVRIWAGDTYANRNTAPFRVTEDGSLTATNATIQSSDSGQRVVLDGVNNRLEFFDSVHGSYVIRMDDNLFGGCAGIYMHDGTGTTYSYISGNGMHFKGQFTDTSSTGFITHTNSGTLEQSAFGVLAQATNPALTARFFGIQVMVSTYYGASPSDGYGVHSYISSAGTNTYGVHGTATGGTNNYGVYGTATGGTNRYGGYFTASAGGTIVRALYTSGAVQMANLPSKSSETYVIWSDASGNLALGLAPTPGGGGTVTSVGLSLPASVFSISGSPVTSSGTLTGSFINQTANYVFAAPNGSAGTPTFRALVAADIPGHTHTYNNITDFAAGVAANETSHSDVVTKSGSSANNRLAAWTGTGNTIRAESNLTFATNTLAIGSASTESVIQLGASGSTYDWFLRHTSGGNFEIKYYNDLKFSLSTTILTLPVALNVDTINEYTTDAGVTIETVNIEDGWISIPTDKGLRCSPGDTDTLKIQAYDIDGTSWTTMIWIASGNTPTININGSAAYISSLAIDDIETYLVAVDPTTGLLSRRSVSSIDSGISSPLTTKGDIWVYSTVDTRLPVGTNGQILSADSTEATGLKWTAPGGSGDVIKDGASISDRFASWSGTGYLLKDSGYSASSFATAGHTHILSNITDVDATEAEVDAVADLSAISTPSVGWIYHITGTSPTTAGWGQLAGSEINNNQGWTSNSGTVTSVALSMPTAIFDITGSPITSAGTFTVTLDTQTANHVFAGPASGAAAAPTFRALVSADLPSHSHTYSDISNFATGVGTYETSHATVVVDADFTSQGLMKRGATSGSYSIVTDNSANWNTAYTHSQLTTGNPHNIGHADISDFATGVATHETSHAVVVEYTGTVTNLHIAVFDGTGGDIKDSGYTTSNFASSTHNHDSDYISIISTPTANNFPLMTAGGELITSSYNASSFATASHNHDSAYISIISTPTANNFPLMTVGGELITSSYNNSSFATAGHTHSTLSQLANGGLATFSYNGASAVTVGLNFTNLTNQTVLADADEFAYYDSGVGMRALTYSALKTALNTDLSFGVALWSDGGDYLTPITSGDSVRVEGTGAGFFVDTTTNTGIVSANSGATIDVYAGGYKKFNFSVNSFISDVNVVISGGNGLYFASGGDISSSASSGSSGNVSIKTGNASSGASGNIFLYTGTYTTTSGEIYFGTGTAGNLQAKTSEINVVFYNTSTGKLSYGNAVEKSGTSVANRFAAWMGTGYNIEDSGYSASSFATAGHTHTSFNALSIYGALEVDNSVADYSVKITNTHSLGHGLYIQTDTYDGDLYSLLCYDYDYGQDLFKVVTTGAIFMPAISSATGNYYLKWTTGGLVTYSASSDIRLKENIRLWDFDSLDFLVNLDLKKFDWKDGSGKDEIGWIAQDIEGHFPEMIGYDKDGFLLIKEPYFLNHFHRAIKQHYAITESHEQKIRRLENRVSELENQLNIN